MHVAEAKEFKGLLAATFDTYSRPAPLPETQALWWKLLEEFDIAAVRMAFGHYARTEKKFPPTPAQILEMLGAGQGDARPGADEAWAIALTSRDERDTVVWTEETAEAFAICRPVLDLGDEVGARVAFKDAYNRLVSAARLKGAAPAWQVSLGFDAERRELVLRKAETAGLLPAPRVAALLPPPAPEMKPTEAAAARAQLDAIRQMLAKPARKGDTEAPTLDAVRTQDLKAATERRVKEFAHGAQ